MNQYWNYNPINEVNTIVGYNPQYSILIKNPGCPKQVLCVRKDFNFQNWKILRYMEIF